MEHSCAAVSRVLREATAFDDGKPHAHDEKGEWRVPFSTTTVNERHDSRC